MAWRFVSSPLDTLSCVFNVSNSNFTVAQPYLYTYEGGGVFATFTNEYEDSPQEQDNTEYQYPIQDAAVMQPPSPSVAGDILAPAPPTLMSSTPTVDESLSDAAEAIIVRSSSPRTQAEAVIEPDTTYTAVAQDATVLEPPMTSVHTTADNETAISTPESAESSANAFPLSSDDIGDVLTTEIGLAARILAAKANIAGETASEMYHILEHPIDATASNMTDDKVIGLSSRLYDAILHPAESNPDNISDQAQLAKYKRSQESAFETCKVVLTKNQWAEDSARAHALIAVVHTKESHVQGIPLRFLNVLEGKKSKTYKIDTQIVDRDLTCTERIEKIFSYNAMNKLIAKDLVEQDQVHARIYSPDACLKRKFMNLETNKDKGDRLQLVSSMQRQSNTPAAAGSKPEASGPSKTSTMVAPTKRKTSMTEEHDGSPIAKKARGDDGSLPAPAQTGDESGGNDNGDDTYDKTSAIMLRPLLTIAHGRHYGSSFAYLTTSCHAKPFQRTRPRCT